MSSKKEINNKLAIGILAIIFLFVISVIFSNLKTIKFKSSFSFPKISSTSQQVKGIEKFSSEQDFKTYLEKGAKSLNFFSIQEGIKLKKANTFGEIGMPAPSLTSEELKRVSETNVQVLGIDEPDIVKTNGKEIYFFSDQTFQFWRELDPMIEPIGKKRIPQFEPNLKVIKAFPIKDLTIEKKIDLENINPTNSFSYNYDKSLLLDKNILIVFSGQKILGYDVSNQKSPEKKWTIEIGEKNQFSNARLYKNKLYLITQTAIDTYRPCPIKPLVIDGNPLEIKCLEVMYQMKGYHFILIIFVIFLSTFD